VWLVAPAVATCGTLTRPRRGRGEPNPPADGPALRVTVVAHLKREITYIPQSLLPARSFIPHDVMRTSPSLTTQASQKVSGRVTVGGVPSLVRKFTGKEDRRRMLTLLIRSEQRIHATVDARIIRLRLSLLPLRAGRKDLFDVPAVRGAGRSRSLDPTMM
jgi:hypothetical protein